MKTEPAIFLRTLKRLGRQPEEAVFIDRCLYAQLDGAQVVGMKAFHFQKGIDLAKALREVGVAF